jgi:hypothetical protein
MLITDGVVGVSVVPVSLPPSQYNTIRAEKYSSGATAVAHNSSLSPALGRKYSVVVAVACGRRRRTWDLPRKWFDKINSALFSVVPPCLKRAHAHTKIEKRTQGFSRPLPVSGLPKKGSALIRVRTPARPLKLDLIGGTIRPSHQKRKGKASFDLRA